MQYLNILHLSDLHISENESPEHIKLRSKLIKDIAEISNQNSLNFDVVAITGDIVDRGGTIEAYSKAKSFINDLINLHINPKSLFFVPGNHDIPRPYPIVDMLKNFDSKILEDPDRSSEYWNYIKTRYNEYNKFVNEYNEECSIDNYKYGCNVTVINKDDKLINVILLNSSWLSIGKNDFNQICISRSQLLQIDNLFRSGGKNPDLTIGLMHHPLDWMSDKDTIEKYITDSDYIPIDVLLHGHIHKSNIKTLSTPDSSFTTLVSGIGYPEEDDRELGQTKLASCRYSAYQINLDTFETEIWLRISNSNGNFCADTTLYEKGKNSGHFKINIKPQQKPANTSSFKTDYVYEVDPIHLVTGWVGRDEIIDNFNYIDTRVFAITGVGGQGKSALASELYKRYVTVEKNTI